MAESSRPWARPAAAGGAVARSERLARVAPAARVVLAWLGVAAAGSWLGFYIITELPYIRIETFRATLTLHAVTGAVFVPYLISLVLRRRLPGGTAVDGALALLIGAYLLATVTSEYWRVSLEVMAMVLMAVGVYYVLSDGWLLRRWQVEAAFMLAVLAAAVWALWIVGGDYVDWLQLTGAVKAEFDWGDLIPPSVLEVHGVGDHKNLLGGILAAGLPFFVVALFRQVSLALRVLIIVAIGAIALAVFLTLARSAWLSAVLGAGSALALLAVLTPRGQAMLRDLKPDTARKQIAIGIASFGLAALVLAAALIANSVESRPIWLFRESGSPRADVMGAGAEMLRDDPWLGTGPGVFGLLYPEFSGKDPNHAVHSHNGYLQAAIDAGLAGVAAVAFALIALAVLLARAMRDTRGEARLSVIACCGALVAFGTFGLLDAPNGYKGPLVALAAVVAVAALAYVERQPSAIKPRGDWELFGTSMARVSAAIAIAAVLIIWGRVDFAQRAYSDAVVAANEGEWKEAIDETQRAVDLDPSFPIYRLQLGLVEGQAFRATGDPALLDDAIASLSRGLADEPRSGIGHANLALLLAESGDRNRARDEALAAQRYANSDAAVVLAAGTALEQSNWGEDAVRAYSRALFLDVGLADSPFWQGSPFRESRFGDIIGSSALVFNPCVLLSLDLDGVTTPLSRGDAITQCTEQVSRSGAEGGQVTLAEAAIEGDNLGQARAILDDVLARKPDLGRARTALGSWYSRQGRIEDARREWVRAGQLGEADALVLLGDSYSEGDVPPEVSEALRAELNETASEVQFHIIGILYYRLKFFRASPITMLVPGDWQQAVPGRYARALDALDRWNGQPAR
jgi:tetratricopeptide (TPR) repeat protein/O-antigen ligase